MSAPMQERVQQAVAAIRTVRCDCYDPDLMEFYGDEPCGRCKAIDLLTGATDE